MFRKFKIILKGVLHLFKFWKFLKKEKIIFIFSSRFGHFLQNTEVLLRDLSRKEIKKTLFVLDEKIDNEELLDIWKKYDLDFCSYEFGTLLRLVKKHKKIINHYDLVPKNKKKYLKNRIIKYLVSENKLSVPYEYLSITFRDSKYNNINYNTFNDEFRDTKKKDMRLLINYFKKRKIHLIKVNKTLTSKVYGIEDYGFNSNYKVENSFRLIKNSKIHIGSSTGIDTFAAFVDKPMINVNTLLGNNFISRLYTFPTFILPINLKFFSNKKIVPLSEQIKFLKYAEDKYQINHLDNKLQKEIGVYYETNSYTEIISCYNEYLRFIKKKFHLDKKLKYYQKKFWSIYPKTYTHKFSKTEITSSRFYGKVFIPSSYFEKYKNFLD